MLLFLNLKPKKSPGSFRGLYFVLIFFLKLKNSQNFKPKYFTEFHTWKKQYLSFHWNKTISLSSLERNLSWRAASRCPKIKLYSIYFQGIHVSQIHGPCGFHFSVCFENWIFHKPVSNFNVSSLWKINFSQTCEPLPRMSFSVLFKINLLHTCGFHSSVHFEE